MNDYSHASLGAVEALLLMERKPVAPFQAYIAPDVYVILGSYDTGSFRHRDKIA